MCAIVYRNVNPVRVCAAEVYVRDVAVARFVYVLESEETVPSVFCAAASVLCSCVCVAGASGISSPVVSGVGNTPVRKVVLVCGISASFPAAETAVLEVVVVEEEETDGRLFDNRGADVAAVDDGCETCLWNEITRSRKLRVSHPSGTLLRRSAWKRACSRETIPVISTLAFSSCLDFLLGSAVRMSAVRQKSGTEMVLEKRQKGSRKETRSVEEFEFIPSREVFLSCLVELLLCVLLLSFTCVLCAGEEIDDCSF